MSTGNSYLYFCTNIKQNFQISPDRGPLKGGTSVTITGKNLGFKPSVISIRIGVATCTDVRLVSPSNK